MIDSAILLYFYGQTSRNEYVYVAITCKCYSSNNARGTKGETPPRVIEKGACGGPSLLSPPCANRKEEKKRIKHLRGHVDFICGMNGD